MASTVRRWRVRRRAGPGEVWIELDVGDGFRPATLPEIDAALLASTGGGTLESGGRTIGWRPPTTNDDVEGDEVLAAGDLR